MVSLGKQRGFRERAPPVPIEKVGEYCWRIPKSFNQGMRVPGLVFADEQIIEKIKTDRTLNQCANVAHLPGIYKNAITLPDGHEGYGFPIGGVAATDYEEGDISGSSYVVQAGDTLWEIAEARYGNGAEWTKILAANSADIGYLPNGSQALIMVGQTLVLP